MALTIKKTGATLNSSINVRNEKHGDEDEGACDFKLSGIMIDKDDLNELYGDKYYHNSLFNTKGKLTEPMTRRNAPLKFLAKFESAHVTLWLGLSDDIVKFSECKLKNITVDPQTGGLCELCLTVQCNPEPAELAKLYIHQNKSISASIRFGKEEVAEKDKRQVEIPIGTVGKDAAGDDTAAVH